MTGHARLARLAGEVMRPWHAPARHGKEEFVLLPSHPFFLHNSEQKEPRSTGLIRPA